MRKLFVAACLAGALGAILPVRAATPPLVLAATPAFAPALVVANGGEAIQVRGVEPIIPHTFTTNDAICDNGAGGAVKCARSIAPGATISVQFAGGAAKGPHQFFCAIHPWMNGFVNIQ